MMKMNAKHVIARNNRWFAFVPLLIGCGLLYVAIDVTFYHHIDRDAPVLAKVILWTVGLPLFLGGIKELLAPSTFLLADASGLTAFVSGQHYVNGKKVAAHRQPILIPWSTIDSVTMGQYDFRQRQTHTNPSRKSHNSDITIRISREVSVAHCSFSSAFGAFDGDAPEALRSDPSLSQSDIEEMSFSRICISPRALSKSPEETASLLRAMRQKYT